MTDPISVLLIIGAAVIGPIEAKFLPVPANNELSKCMKLAGKSDTTDAPRMKSEWEARLRYCRIEVGEKSESLSELCARAMREIGAVAVTFPHEKGKRTEWILFDANAIPPDRLRVHCIPTPSGYRK